jgi:hypothetical protein
MRILLAALVLVALAACGSDGGDVATDDGGASGGPVPGEVPAASGPVHTRGLVTVMDTGRPELCLGPVAESWPPQCGGPPLADWDWGDRQGMFERQGDVRWGEFAVTGTFDGTTFTVTDAVPAALYDPPELEEPTYPPPATSYSQARLDEIAETLGSELAGAQGAFVTDGHVVVDVVHDDGSLQAWADETYGANVVVVWSALVPGR